MTYHPFKAKYSLPQVPFLAAQRDSNDCSFPFSSKLCNTIDQIIHKCHSFKLIFTKLQTDIVKGGKCSKISRR